MIISKEIEIPKTNDLTSEYIETELKKLSISDPLRWAITEVCSETYVICVSYEI